MPRKSNSGDPKSGDPPVPMDKTARKTERSHEENQERAYIAASRRSDRSIEARVQSARMASDIHKKRTGKGFKVTEQIVLAEEMYEEEDDVLPRSYRLLSAGMQTASPEMNARLEAYLSNKVAMSRMLALTNDQWRENAINKQFAASFGCMVSPQLSAHQAPQNAAPSMFAPTKQMQSPHPADPQLDMSQLLSPPLQQSADFFPDAAFPRSPAAPQFSPVYYSSPTPFSPDLNAATAPMPPPSPASTVGNTGNAVNTASTANTGTIGNNGPSYPMLSHAWQSRSKSSQRKSRSSSSTSSGKSRRNSAKTSSGLANAVKMMNASNSQSVKAENAASPPSPVDDAASACVSPFTADLPPEARMMFGFDADVLLGQTLNNQGDQSWLNSAGFELVSPPNLNDYEPTLGIDQSGIDSFGCGSSMPSKCAMPSIDEDWDSILHESPPWTNDFIESGERA